MTLADTLTIRELAPSDALAGAGLARSRGWSYEPERWRFTLEVGRAWGAFDVEGRVSGTPGGLVGAVQLTGCTGEVAVVGSMLVAEPLERRGLGRALLGRALDAAGGRTVALSATRRGRPLYERAGFRPVGELVMHHGTLRPGQGAARTRSVTEADVPAIAVLDALAQGGDRTPLLAAALLRFASAARVLTAGRGQVRAFGAAWASEGRMVVGPLVAEDGESAAAVLDDLARDLPGPARIDVRTLDGGSATRAGILAWLDRHGFEAFARTALMVRPPRDLPGRAGLIVSPIMQSTT